MKSRIGRRVIVAALATLAFAVPASAQETLPRPDAPFEGTIGRTAKDSKPDFPKEVQPPEDAPNILLIMTDDVGYGAGSPFGGPIAMPTLDRLAQAGVRYTNFHTTALCSPHAGGTHHRAQPSFGADRRDRGVCNGLSRL